MGSRPSRKRNAAAPEDDDHRNEGDEQQQKPASPPKRRKQSNSKDKTQLQKDLSTYPVGKVFRLIEPGPVLLVTTGSMAENTHNVMTIGFHMMMQHDSPALIGTIIGPWDASFKLLKKYRECVLAVPSVGMACTTVDIGNCSGADTRKFEKFGLETRPAGKVSAPLVVGVRVDSHEQHVIANIECVVEDDRMVDRYSLWVLRVVKAWVHPEQDPRKTDQKMFHHLGQGEFSVDGERKLDLRERMVLWKEFQDD
jgi:flavin reductase (DIM6/NTAB) family NADH-FMN oxidoreductase RutF